MDNLAYNSFSSSLDLCSEIEPCNNLTFYAVIAKNNSLPNYTVTFYDRYLLKCVFFNELPYAC